MSIDGLGDVAVYSKHSINTRYLWARHTHICLLELKQVLPWPSKFSTCLWPFSAALVGHRRRDVGHRLGGGCGPRAGQRTGTSPPLPVLQQDTVPTDSTRPFTEGAKLSTACPPCASSWTWWDQPPGTSSEGQATPGPSGISSSPCIPTGCLFQSPERHGEELHCDPPGWQGPPPLRPRGPNAASPQAVGRALPCQACSPLSGMFHSPRGKEMGSSFRPTEKGWCPGHRPGISEAPPCSLSPQGPGSAWASLLRVREEPGLCFFCVVPLRSARGSSQVRGRNRERMGWQAEASSYGCDPRR